MADFILEKTQGKSGAWEYTPIASAIGEDGVEVKVRGKKELLTLENVKAIVANIQKQIDAMSLRMARLNLLREQMESDV